MVTNTWQVEWLDIKLTDGNFSNVVVVVGWRCNGVDGDYTATAYGTCSLPSPTENFIPYNDLTKQQVLDWIYANGVDKTVIENSIAENIEAQKNPPIVRTALPWS